MNFSKALGHAKSGARIRRECWDTPVVHTERGMHFLLPAELSAKLGTAYEPTEIDRASCDWLVLT